MNDYFDKFYNSLDRAVYSVIDIGFSVKILNPSNLINDEKYSKTYTKLFLKSEYDNEIKHLEAIFRYVTGFYIYLKRQDDDSFSIRIIYKPENYEEIKLYINGLKKIKN